MKPVFLDEVAKLSIFVERWPLVYEARPSQDSLDRGKVIFEDFINLDNWRSERLSGSPEINHWDPMTVSFEYENIAGRLEFARSGAEAVKRAKAQAKDLRSWGVLSSCLLAGALEDYSVSRTFSNRGIDTVALRQQIDAWEGVGRKKS